MAARTRRPRTPPAPTDPPNLSPALVLVAELSADPANLRLHGERSLEAITASLRRFGQQKPIVIDRRGVVVAGHGVLAAAKALGWTRIAAVRTRLEGPDRVGYAIADNRSAEFSQWDGPALAAVLGAMDEDLRHAAGYTAEELAELVGDPEDVEDGGPPAPLPVAITRPGDLWHLGEHRLLCGDSTDAAAVARLMGGRRAALVATDPPYLVDYTGERVGGTGKDWSGQYHEVEITDAEGFFLRLFERVLEVMAPHAAIYCWHAHRRCGLIQRVWEALDILDHQQVIWIKPASVFGACMYHFQHEPCMVGWKRGSKPRHDGRHDTTSVWVLPWSEKASLKVSEASDVWVADWEGKSRVVGNEHPTQKPVELFARPMRKHTRRGDVCFEPFSGSGTQLVAAEQLGRRCYAIELEPVFVDVAIRRWQTLTGNAASLGANGPAWAKVARERGVSIDGDPPCPPSPSEPVPTPDARGSRRRASTARRTPSSGPAKTTRGRPRKPQPRRGAMGRGGDG